MAAKMLTFSEAAVFSNLGKLSTSSFCCGGPVPQVNGVNLVYKKQYCGGWSSLQLPVGSKGGENLQKFLEACYTASFDISGETVTDNDCCDILKLDPKCFCANFEVASTTILSDIINIMSIGSSIRAELNRLNVYSTVSHFDTHVDTSCSKDMFGSLVVCLPSQFTGGALVTRHQGCKVTFDWSSSPVITHWAAFFSGVEHEVLPVTSGHRISLTYNLYYSLPIQPRSFDVTTSPLYQELLAALQTPHFMKEGGTLGFFCQHKYIETLEDGYHSVFNFLKGIDMMIYQVAKSLGLSVTMKLIFKGRNDDLYAIPRFGHREPYSLWNEDKEYEIEYLRRVFGHGDISTVNIRWCSWTIKWELPILSTVSYSFKKPPASVVYYQCAALLVKVPKSRSAYGEKNVPTVNKKVKTWRDSY